MKGKKNMNLLNAFGLLNMINEGMEDYQEEYKNYIIKHKERVQQFADWLKENCPEVFDGVDLDAFDEVIAEHDESKFGEEEFEPYAQKFFKGQDINGKPLDYIPGFDEAWKHHYMNNEHHPEHWFGEDMPFIYILEMLCDWGSFSIDKGDLTELSDFYYNNAKDDEEKNLSDNTKEIIEEILTKIDFVLESEEDD
jgi:hypothetical protein